MQLLFRITSGYFLFGAALVMLFRDNPEQLIFGIVTSAPSALIIFFAVSWWALPLAGLLLFVVPRAELMTRLVHGFGAIFASVVFFLTFNMIKTTMPDIVPFWADPGLARLDEVLHFGQVPWEMAHRAAPWVNATLAGKIYFVYWTPVALFLPVFLIVFDHDHERVVRFIKLYAFAWIGVGNILAIGFMSAGPVYFDRLLGSDAFAGLGAALAHSGVTETTTGAVQQNLWSMYLSGTSEAGSGISAFPSVHLAIASVAALYLAERWRALLPVSLAIVAVFLFLSVYLGWHYAVDGYASIALITGVWAVMRRRINVPDASVETAGLVAAE